MKGTKTEVSPGVWQLRVYVGRRPNGTPVQVRRTVHGGVRKADSELAAMVTKADKGKLRLSSGGPTVEAVIADYFERCELEGLSPTTMREYRRLAEKVVIPALGNVRAEKLTPKQLNALYATLLETGNNDAGKGNKATTVRRVHALISASLAYAVKQEQLEHNVARLATPPKVKKAKVEGPNPNEAKKILRTAEASDPLMAALLRVSYNTGARRGELCALRWSDVNWSKKTLTIARSVYETEGGGWGEKGTKADTDPLVLPLGSDTLKALRRYRKDVEKMAQGLELQIPDNTFMFSLSPTGTEPVRPDYVTKRAISISEAAGVRSHLHTLRHSVATDAAARFDPTTVSHRLNHSDQTVTLKFYTNHDETRDRELAEYLDARLR